MRFSIRVISPAVAVCLVACSQPVPSLHMTATPTTIVAGASSCVAINITGNVNGEPLNPDMDPFPTETTTYGVLIDPSQGDSSGSTTIQGNVTGTAIQLQLCATDNTPGMATVNATVTDLYNVTATATVTVDFTAPMSTTCDGGTCLAAQSITFSCTCENIDALYDMSTTLVTGCSAVARDVMGNQLDDSAISFLSEAGQILESDMSSGEAPFLYYPHQLGDGVMGSTPQDVSPFSGEPNWTDDVGHTYNPRDGLATLVAYAEGDNSTAVGQFAGDPFVDANDNNSYDVGELYFPSAGTGAAYSATQTKYIWTQTKILWSNTLSTNPEVATVMHAPSSLSLNIGGSEMVTYQLVDDNFNALASNDSAADNITWNIQPSQASAMPATSPYIDTWGIKIDPSNSYEILDPTSATSYLIGVDYTVAVTNNRTPMDGLGALDWTLNGSITRTGILDDMGEDGSNVMETTATLSGPLLDQ